MAACTCARETSGRRRATIQAQFAPGSMISPGRIMAGTHTSGCWSTSTPRKPRAATPITVSGCSSTTIFVR